MLTVLKVEKSLDLVGVHLSSWGKGGNYRDLDNSLSNISRFRNCFWGWKTVNVIPLFKIGRGANLVNTGQTVLNQVLGNSRCKDRSRNNLEKCRLIRVWTCGKARLGCCRTNNRAFSLNSGEGLMKEVRLMRYIWTSKRHLIKCQSSKFKATIQNGRQQYG